MVAEFILLLFLCDRFRLSIIIIISGSLVATTAVFSRLWLTSVELNITAIMGMAMIIGAGAEMAVSVCRKKDGELVRQGKCWQDSASLASE